MAAAADGAGRRTGGRPGRDRTTPRPWVRARACARDRTSAWRRRAVAMRRARARRRRAARDSASSPSR
ncbi:hypothetical protein E9549_19990 [Blastococcus sp. MG754426]|nr:hypothetical protein [Blastococcus sp. MG754426]MCF6510719.1 hypothetical protein [Blastococcus sp. MG754427]MCF6737166.1 hypothetical protein [Blastococcus sp. KM273129]